MRDNWDDTESRASSADQHNQQMQQHQPEAMEHNQQTIVSSGAVMKDDGDHQSQQNGHVLPPTPPSTAVVRTEPQEDKNNDSGISPGHYMSESSPSPTSSLFTANCSLSPVSASSNDSNMQVSYENHHQVAQVPHMSNGSSALGYAHPSHENATASVVAPTSASSPNDASQHALISQNSQPQQQQQYLSPDQPSTSRCGMPGSPEMSPDPLQCPICLFSTQSRMLFSRHLGDHCNTDSDRLRQQYVRAVLSQLTKGASSIASSEEPTPPSPSPDRSPSESENEVENEPGVAVPRVNTHGKVKTFKCKTCNNFVAITKIDFWNHTRTHIKPEKLLTCPQCPFVTEYKHHLEYHLRNHFKSKPYKCGVCEYTCVNKSMLNSHLKSHSSIYQFRCASCSYASKYCHSLKLHLRKYLHNPAMVLNSDGSPNPNPIIDIYGTKRGPKTKSVKRLVKCQPRKSRCNSAGNEALPPAIPRQVMPPVHLPQANQMSGMNGIAATNGFNGFVDGMNNGSNGLALSSVATMSPAILSAAYQLFGAFPGSNAFPVNNTNANDSAANANRQLQINMEIAHKMQEDMKQKGYSPISFNHGMTINNSMPINAEQEPALTFNGFTGSAENSSSSLDLSTKPAEGEVVSSEPKSVAPLDLSKSELNQPSTSSSPPTSPMVSSNSPKSNGTSRRKGRAYKIDRRSLENSTANEEAHQISDENMDHSGDNSDMQQSSPSTSPQSASSKEATDDTDANKPKDDDAKIGFKCNYCDISFGNEIMYTVHMGLHGFKNPYVCNSCGLACEDGLTFYMHILRAKH